MSRPYIPQGMPITVTVDGHWDGLHNGNEPYMTYLGHDGQTRRVHIPHGAYVQTNPEEAPDVAFTVDKTPKHPHDYSDVTDTGEPLDAESKSITYSGQCTALNVFDGRRCSRPQGHSGVHEYEPLAQWEAELLAAVGEGAPRKPEPGDRVRVTYEASYARKPSGYEYTTGFDGSFGVGIPKDAEVTVIEPARPAVPEEPEPGDRGPKIGDTVAVPLNDENGTIIVGSLVATYDDKFWIEGDDFDLQVPHQGSRITVIEPARPAVPEEPGDSVQRVEGKSGDIYLREYGDEVDEDHKLADYWIGPNFSGDWESVWHRDGPLYRNERGPVIGG